MNRDQAAFQALVKTLKEKAPGVYADMKNGKLDMISAKFFFCVGYSQGVSAGMDTASATAKKQSGAQRRTK